MKRLSVLCLTFLVFSNTVVALRWAAGAGSAHARASRAGYLSALLYIDGSLGDLGFFDSANAGVQRAKQQLGISTKVVQNADATQWQTQLLSLAGTKKYDVIIISTDASALLDAAKVVVKRYPNQKIIDFDDNSLAKVPSVSTAVYKQNEGSFLAGALAALVAGSKLPYVSHKNIIGMVGGQQIPVIVDFQDGYVQGAKLANPKMDVRVTFIGGSGSDDTWNNKPAGARLASSLYNAGAAVVYQVAGGSGLGVLAQSKVSGRYAIGVDSNQDSVAPGHVIGSVVKRVDNSLFDLLKLAQQGRLQGAHTYSYGLQNHGVDLTRDSYTRAIVTPAMYKQLDSLESQVISGKIKVKSEFH
jgi:basic membrane protein A